MNQMKNNRKRKTSNHLFQLLILIVLVAGMSLTEFSESHKDMANVDVIEGNSQMASRSLVLKNIQAKPSVNIQKEDTVLINDPGMNKKWGLTVTESLKAWKVSQGSRDIVVAVIDTGMDDLIKIVIKQ